jgi:hypothetical protein
MRFRTLIPTPIVAAAAVLLLAAGCGSSSGATAAATGETGLVAYSNCIRSHGVPNFPDPTSSEGIPKDEIPVSNPKLPGASNACEHLMPAGGLGPQTTPHSTRTRLADALSFARCMRSHGLTSFPDPTTQGDLSVEMLQAQGVDVHSPAVLRTVHDCLPASHGWLTAAKVRQALNSGGG